MTVEVKSSRFVNEKSNGNVAGPLNITEVSTEESIVKPVDPSSAANTVGMPLQYPLSEDQQKRYSSSITFRPLKITGAGIKEGKGDGEVLENVLKKLTTFKKVRENENGTVELKVEENPDLDAFTPREVNYQGGNIKLYLPVAFQQNDTFNIANTELGPAVGAATSALSEGSSIMSAAGKAVERGLSGISDAISGNFASQTAKLGAARLAKRIPLVGSEASQGTEIAFAVTVNPNLRSAFRGVNLREFSFSFKFIARSAAEADQIEQIIKTLRTRAYPDIVNLIDKDNNVSMGYSYPDLFEIVVRHEPTGKRVGQRMKFCFLRSVATSYNSSSMAFHKDGQPVEIDLSLNFVEEHTLVRRVIEAGFECHILSIFHLLYMSSLTAKKRSCRIFLCMWKL